MRPSPTRDLVAGLFVLAGLGAVAYLSIQVGGISYSGPGGFTLKAGFNDIGGLKVRSPVVISGVKVGQVTAITLDEVLRAQVILDLDPSLELDADTSASIRTSGLLGDQFVNLEPGGAEELLASGDEISYTQSALAIESLVSKLVTNLGGNDGESRE